MNIYIDTFTIQDTTNATRALVTPVGASYTTFNGEYHSWQNVMIEARGRNGEYCRSFSKTKLGEKQ